MRLFDVPQARHFCNPPVAVTAGVGSQSLRDFHMSLKAVTRLTEGQTNFHVHQVNLLWAVDRWLLFSISHYRRAVEMLIPASLPWAQVTLYYASFFAANAILGMFGGWVGQTKDGVRVVDVEHGTENSQVLRIFRRPDPPTGVRGSHQIFWDFFYDSAAAIVAWAPDGLETALEPANGEITWQIAERNNVNYDMYHAWEASKLFVSTFRPKHLSSLRGPVRLQLDTSETMIKLALHFAADLNIATTALDGCGETGTPAQLRRRFGSQRPPELVSQSEFRAFVM